MLPRSPMWRRALPRALPAAILGMTAGAARAGTVPDGSEYIMADWMLLSFLSFAGAALAVFLIAARRGAFRNMEAAKYYLLTVKEQDFYTPEWAREGDDNAA